MSDVSMTCRAVRDALPIHEALPQAARLRAHLDTCADCRAIAGELSELLLARRTHANEELPAMTEERILARLRPVIAPERRLRWWQVAAWSAVAVALVAGVVFAAVALRYRGVLSLTASVGEVTTSTPALTVGATLGTATRGRALVELPRSRIAALANTAVRIDAAKADDIHLSVERGALVADVDPNPARPRRFAVTLPNAEVVVTGTRFFVAAYQGRAQVAVERGHVRVRVGTQVATLGVGEVLDIDADATMRRRSLDPGEGSRINAALRVSEWASDGVEELGRGLPRAEPQVVSKDEERAVEPAPELAPHEATRAEVSPRKAKTVQLDPKASANGGLDEVRDQLGKRDCDRASALAAPLRARGDEASRVWFALAQCYHAAERREEAAAAYAEVVRRFPKAAVSENAAYETARLSRELGRNRIAESAFVDYLEKYPNGALAEEATFWRCHLAAVNEHPRDAISCLQSFRVRFAASTRATETYFSEATLRRTANEDCKGAIAAYDAYLARNGEKREQAERWKKWCEARVR